MRKLIRRSVFETNSSSAHSITLAGDQKDFVLDTIYPDQHGCVYVSGGQFGWGWDRFNDAATKLSYAYQDNVEQERLERVIKEVTGATEVIFDASSKADGYIDHESVGTARAVCVSDVTTKDFIFNKNSWLFIGNDNSAPDPTMFHVPEFKGGRMIMPEFTYELKIDGIERTTQYLTKPNDEELANGIDSLLDDALMTEDGHIIINKDIFYKINRPRGVFYEKSWHARQNYSKGFIVMTKENAVYPLETELDKDPNFKKLDWNKRAVRLTKELFKRGLAKELHFQLTKIR